MSRNISVLNGIRGLAILVVLDAHIGLHVVSGEMATIAVSVFFVLSGFLITRSLLDRRDNKENIAQFFAARMARIFPIYYLVIFVISLVYMYLGESLREIPWALQYRYNEIYNGHGTIAAFWSLSVEEQFYLFSPFLIFWLPRKLIPWIFSLLGFAAAYWTFRYGHSGPMVYVGLIANIPVLSIGVILAYVYDKLSSNTILRLFIYTAIVTVMFNTICRDSSEIPTQTNRVLCAVCLFLIGIYHDKAPGWAALKSILEDKVIAWLAKISYCVYLIHIPVWVFISSFNLKVHPYFNNIMAILITLILAELSNRYFEGPIIRFVKKVMTPRNPNV